MTPVSVCLTPSLLGSRGTGCRTLPPPPRPCPGLRVLSLRAGTVVFLRKTMKRVGWGLGCKLSRLDNITNYYIERYKRNEFSTN